MLITRGIAMSDGVNRKNHYIGLSAILNAYEQSWRYGVPSNLNHDSTKFIGWTFLQEFIWNLEKHMYLNQ